MVGVVLFALAISLNILLARIASERLVKLAGERQKRERIAGMWSRLPR